MSFGKSSGAQAYNIENYGIFIVRVYEFYTPSRLRPVSNLYAPGAHRLLVGWAFGVAMAARGLVRSVRACLRRPVRGGVETRPWETSMLDILVLAITVVFFAGAIAYVHACDRL
jgi:hypothetical protein